MKVVLKLTKLQYSALINIVDEFDGGLGGGDNDEPRYKWVKNFDQMLNSNGYER